MQRRAICYVSIQVYRMHKKVVIGSEKYGWPSIDRQKNVKGEKN